MNAPARATPVHVTRMDMLDEACSISERMLRHAREHQWERVTLLDADRQRLLAEALAEPVAPDESAGVREVLERIIDINREIMLLGDEDRQQFARDIEQCTRGRRAHRAYTSNL